MATLEHITLSTYIKNVHINLRNNSKKLGFESAWQEHCQNTATLNNYASAMKKLAEEFWDENEKCSDKVISRITWMYEYTQKYYMEELMRQRNRELEILEKINDISAKTTYTAYKMSKKLKVLDVGSCYNPFKRFQNFDVTPIDIAPSTDDVYKCDFMSLNINDDRNIMNGTVTGLQSQSFDIVVFSLLLEYIPSPDQRLLCCQNAYDLLDFEGLLVIITPDSKHVGANAKYMKSWRYTLSLMGFSRIKYEKLPYLHCMVFRKAINIDVSKRWATLHQNEGLDKNIFIPQDFQESTN